ncbi:MAG: HU family DNA-binding protein [Robiginitomaculum sp.]|nr:HU family DNA-binding protein [Robiginitomaculum sp.]
MNKSELAENVATECDMTKAQALEAVNAVFSTIEKTLGGGGEVRVPGFGSFTVAHRAAGMARNPRTGEMVKRPASKRPKFKAGKSFKDCVNC